LSGASGDGVAISASDGGSGSPRWDLSAVYGGFDSPAYRSDKEKASRLSDELLSFLKSVPSVLAPGGSGAWLAEAIARFNALLALIENLSAYCYAVFSTDTRDAAAVKELNAVEDLALKPKRASVAFREILGERKDEIGSLMAGDAGIAAYRFFLEEELFWRGKQMGAELEDLAEDLNRSGGSAWGRLQEAISSVTTAVWDEGTGERKTVIELRTLAFDPDRAVRERAFRKEIEAWKSVAVPMAAAINGVKGFMISLNGRRGWSSALDKSVAQARMTGKAVEALIGAMRASLPVFRSYLKAKARSLSLPKCAFFDLFAPVGTVGRKYGFDEAREIIVGNFTEFSPALGDFAARAFRERWLDAEPREGKIGGAYCVDFPIAGESRVLANYDGSFSSVITLAHELGHAYHHETVKDLPHVLADYPMTLAETASIFGETVVFEKVMAGLPPDERLGPLELSIQDPTQVIVDILSRFIFEKALCERRASGELSSEELCSLMVDAEKEAYGDGLDQGELHPYMWAVKGHYYNTDLAFYNFPYAFGLLFALALYSRYRREGPGFASTYREILRDTGRKSATEVARSAGFDIESREFWDSGLGIVADRIKEFERLTGGA
jgi:oligoendopeptidase F